MELYDYLADAILSLRPASEFYYRDRDYSTIEWIKLDGEAPTIVEIESEIKRIKAAELKLEKDRVKAKSDLLTKLGITADEAALLLS
jgi:hypothetical protein